MVIESLKAALTALKEAMKDKDMSEASRKSLKESDAALQKLLAKAQEAAKEAGMKCAGEEEEGYEAGMAGEEGGHIDPHAVAPGHKMTKTVMVKHEGGEEEEGAGSDDSADADDDDDKDKKDAEESKRGYIRTLLKEAGIPKKLWSLDKLCRLGLAEAKAEIAEKQALIEEVRKASDIDMVPAGAGEPVHESTGAAAHNLNSLFTGCTE